MLFHFSMQTSQNAFSSICPRKVFKPPYNLSELQKKHAKKSYIRTSIKKFLTSFFERVFHFDKMTTFHSNNIHNAFISQKLLSL